MTHAVLAILLDVNFTPDPSQLPGSQTVTNLVNGIMGMGLIVGGGAGAIALIGLVGARASAAVGLGETAMRWFGGVAVFALGIGGLAGIINFFLHQGQGIH